MLVSFRSPMRCRGASSLLLILFVGTVSAAEKIEWRADYDSARKEANLKNKPLFLDFGTEDCVHCKRMHQTTFKDPLIVKLINDHFVPLKIDANREPKLAQSLRIQAYPTMILAGNDGKILGWIEGFMEVGRMQEQLQRASLLQTPDWMARDYQEATKSVDLGDYARAISLLKNVVDDGKERSVQTKAREALQDIELLAAGRLTRAKQLDEKGQTLEALDLLTDLLRQYAGSKAALDGGKMLTALADKPDARTRQRGRRADELLTLAREDFKAERYLRSLDNCELLIAAYRDMPESKEGDKIAAEIKGDPERMARVCEAMNDRLAIMYVTLADSFMQKGQSEQGMMYLNKVVKLNPSSAAAVTASARLKQIQTDQAKP